MILYKYALAVCFRLLKLKSGSCNIGACPTPKNTLSHPAGFNQPFGKISTNWREFTLFEEYSSDLTLNLSREIIPQPEYSREEVPLKPHGARSPGFGGTGTGPISNNSSEHKVLTSDRTCLWGPSLSYRLWAWNCRQILVARLCTESKST